MRAVLAGYQACGVKACATTGLARAERYFAEMQTVCHYMMNQFRTRISALLKSRILSTSKFSRTIHVAGHPMAQQPTEPVATTPAKCYELGIKCVGAGGYPHYQDKPCWDAKAKCLTNIILGWGKLCKVGSRNSRWEEKRGRA